MASATFLLYIIVCVVSDEVSHQKEHRKGIEGDDSRYYEPYRIRKRLKWTKMNFKKWEVSLEDSLSYEDPPACFPMVTFCLPLLEG